jgi:hypothetical protein
VVVLAYVAVAVFATWPLALHPLGGFYGFGNDNWGGIPYLGWLHDAYLGPGSASLDPELQAPYGLEIPTYGIQPMDRLFSLVLGGFGQGLGTYNAQIFLSFVLAGCTMYLAARYLTGSRLAAFIAGFVFTFSPFHLSVAMQYNALASIQWIPLYLLALIVLLQRHRRRDAVLAGAAFALVTVTSYYYAWFVVWFTALVFVYVAIAGAFRLARRRLPLRPEAARFLRLTLSRGALALAVALTLTVPLVFTSAQGAAEADAASVEHPITEAVRYSARPWMLFVPPHDNPVVGDRVSTWVQEHLFDSPVYEQSIYLGYTVLLLALVALWRRRGGLELSELAQFARGILVAGGAAGLLIMIGPYIPIDWGYGYWRDWAKPDAVSHFPSLGRLMYELGPMFRFFTRAFILVSACLCLLAAIGFARLEGLRWMTPVRRLGLAAVVLALIALEYTNAPPHLWYSAERPAWVNAVADLPPKSVVVDYPVPPVFTSRSLYYMFWQTKHRRFTTNPYLTPQAAALAATIVSPDDPAAGAALHRAGVDYAVVHTRLPPQTTPPYQPQLPDDSMPADAGSLNPWLRVAARTPDAILYRVLSTPRSSSGAFVRPSEGFGPPEREAGTRARWLVAPTGTLTLFVTGRRRPLQMVLPLISFGQRRRVAVRLDGRQIAVFEVGTDAYTTPRIQLGRPTQGRHEITLETQPGPQSIAATTGLPDPRSVSIRLREPITVGRATPARGSGS